MANDKAQLLVRYAPPYGWHIIDPREVEWERCEGTVEVAYVEPAYRADDGYYETAYPDAASGRAAAEAYAADFQPADETYWVRIRTWRAVVGISDAGELVHGHTPEEVHRIAIRPVAPPCVDHDDHRWASPHEVVGGHPESPGVWAHGAGLIQRWVCQRCGTYYQVNSWATDPATGEQGLHSVRYDEPDRVSCAWIEARRGDGAEVQS